MTPRSSPEGLCCASLRRCSLAGLAAALAIGATCSGAKAQDRAQAAPPCGGEAFARGAASRTLDGRTFVLDDGREIRLAAIEVPAIAAGAQPPAGAPAAKAAKDALAAILAGA